MHGSMQLRQFTDTEAGIPCPPKTVLAHGCFDLLHLGHIRHLKAARSLGDRLVVSITADQHVQKGPGRPRFTIEQRIEALRALDCVSDVIVSESGDAVGTINAIKPAVYVKGIDYMGSDNPGLAREIAAVESHGGRFEITRTDKWSSSRLLNSETLPAEVMAYLDRARERGFRDKIHEAFDRADKLNVVFIGETIEDEYVYVSPLGKPAKEAILATVETNRELFQGGVRAAALHGEWPKSDYVTPDVSIRKTRFVDRDFTRKLFESYSARRLELTEDQRHRFHTDLIAALRVADVAILFDFGHGLMDASERHIAESAKFLAVNTQTNAGNYGFNLVTKYRAPHYICIDEPEARLAAGCQDHSIEDAISRLWTQHYPGGVNIVVTRGRYGAVSYRAPDASGKHNVPPFATHGLDTMGAGDAFLAVTAPLVAAGLELEAAAFVGNVAGAIKVSIVGHRRHVTRAELMQSIESLLA